MLDEAKYEVTWVENVPMLIGDWFFPALHASFSAASVAQLKGPLSGP
jgi:hypothetical protein